MAVPYTPKRDSDVRQKILPIIIVLLLFLPFGIFFGYSPLLATALFFAGIYAAIIVLHPLWGTLAYIIALPFGALLNLPVTQDGFRISMVFLLTTFPLLMVRNLVTKGRDFLITPLSKMIHILVLSFFLVTVLSLVNSASAFIALSEIQKLIYCFTGYFLIVLTIKDIKSLNLFVTALLVSGFLISVIGIAEGITGTNIYGFFQYRSVIGAPVPAAVLHIQEGRICGPVGDADFHSFYMVTVFMFALYAFHVSRTRLLKVSLLLLMLLCVLNVIGAGARGAGIAFVIAIIVFLWFVEARGKWLIFGLTALAIVAAFLFMNIFLPDLVIERFYDPEVGAAAATVKYRIFKTMIALKMFPDHPIIGHGPLGYTINFFRYSRLSTSDSPGVIPNTYLQVLTGFGIVGLIIFLWIFVVLIRSVFSLATGLDQKYRFMAAAMLAWLLGLCVFMLFDPCLTRDMIWPPIALSVALCSMYENNLNRTTIP